MRTKIFVPAALAFAFLLSAPVLGNAAHEQHGAPGAQAPGETGKPGPAVDAVKAYLLNQEYVAKTAELHGKLKAREAELETTLATKPGEEAAIKKLTTEISSLRAQLFEQKTLFRLRYAKETGTPIRLTQHLGSKAGMMEGMMGDGGMDCKMMGKGMGKGMMMGMEGMDHSGKAAIGQSTMPPMPGMTSMPPMPTMPPMPGVTGVPPMPGMPGMPPLPTPATKETPAEKP